MSLIKTNRLITISIIQEEDRYIFINNQYQIDVEWNHWVTGMVGSFGKIAADEIQKPSFKETNEVVGVTDNVIM